MRLVIGGKAQGKLAYALAQTGISATLVCDGGCCPLDSVPRAPVIGRVHLLVRRLLEAGAEPQAFIKELLRVNPGAVFLADEVGCGVVPVDGFEREWREAAGRACCILAREAERVDRVYAGLAERIK